MEGLLSDLFAHQAWADASLLQALRQHPAAWADSEVRSVAHHIVAVQRFFYSLARHQPFSAETEARLPDTVGELARIFEQTVAENTAWLASLTPADLDRTVELPRLATEITIREALTQVVMHSQGHRSQLLTAIRKHGGSPPVLDYILWASRRPEPEWL